MPDFSTPPAPSAGNDSLWFKDHVQPHEPALRSYLYGRVPSASDIDDVVQDSYLKILRARPAGGIISIKGYLFTIARNTAAKLFRKQKFISPVPVSELPVWRVLDDAQDVAATANAHLRDALVADAIAQLPKRCREILLLRVADGLSPTEIAGRLQVSESTVRTQLARGVEQGLPAAHGGSVSEGSSDPAVADAKASGGARVQPEATVEVEAGRRVVVSVGSREARPLALQPVSSGEIATALTWRRQRLEFNGITLAEAVELFNRVNQVQLAVADPETGALRITGVFWTHDPEAFSRVVGTNPTGSTRWLLQSSRERGSNRRCGAHPERLGDPGIRCGGGLP